MMISGEFGVWHKQRHFVLPPEARGLSDFSPLTEPVEPIHDGQVAFRRQVFGQPVSAWCLGGWVNRATAVELIGKAVNEPVFESMGMAHAISASAFKVTPSRFG